MYVGCKNLIFLCVCPLPSSCLQPPTLTNINGHIWACPFGGRCEHLSTPPQSVIIFSETVKGTGYTASSPPYRIKTFHVTLEHFQASSTRGFRRGKTFRLWAEGQRAAASLHAEEFCCFLSRVSLLHLWQQRWPWRRNLQSICVRTG